jgi:polysaccharide pyruvyl transferase WcaK-like protein
MSAVTNQSATGPVLLCGAFGQRNPGDEALLTAFRGALAGTPVVATSSDPEHTEWAHGIDAVLSTSPRAVVKAVNESSAVVFAGGTVFKTLPAESGRHPRSLLRNAVALATLARARGRGPLLVGVGAGDLTDRRSHPLARALARQAELLILRDAASAQALTGLGVPSPLRVGADAVWTLVDDVPAMRTRSADRPDRVVVVMSRWSTDVGRFPALATALQRLVDRGMTVQIQPWQIGAPGLDDLDLAEHLASQLIGDVHVIGPPIDLIAAVRVFADARLVISARFHGLVAAAAAGTTSLALGGIEPKQESLSARLRQPVVSVAASPDQLAAAMFEAIDAPAAAASLIRAEAAAAGEGFRLLRLMLDGGTSPAEDINGLRLEPAA